MTKIKEWIANNWKKILAGSIIASALYISAFIHGCQCGGGF